jgi:hypothetical protein
MSKRTKAVKNLIDKVSYIKKSEKSEPYTKDEITEIKKILKDTFNSFNYGRDAEIITAGSEISVKTLFDSFLANLLKTSDTDTKID